MFEFPNTKRFHASRFFEASQNCGFLLHGSTIGNKFTCDAWWWWWLSWINKKNIYTISMNSLAGVTNQHDRLQKYSTCWAERILSTRCCPNSAPNMIKHVVSRYVIQFLLKYIVLCSFCCYFSATAVSTLARIDVTPSLTLQYTLLHCLSYETHSCTPFVLQAYGLVHCHCAVTITKYNGGSIKIVRNSINAVLCMCWFQRVHDKNDFWNIRN